MIRAGRGGEDAISYKEGLCLETLGSTKVLGTDVSGDAKRLLKITMS